MNIISGFSDSNELNLAKSCRVCLSSDVKDMICLFNDSDHKIFDKIEYCTGVQLKQDKDLPTLLCRNCHRKLSIAHKFKEMCLLTEQALQQFLLNRVKVEITDDISFSNSDNSLYNDVDNCPFFTIKAEDKEEKQVIKTDKLKQETSVIRKSKRKLKEQKPSEPDNVKRMKRGPYKKGGAARTKKYKFTKLFCEPCNLKFTSKEESDKHKKDLHPECSWICEICGKIFTHRGTLYTHVRSHRSPCYACAHCDYSSSIKNDLVKHLLIHMGIKKYECGECEARYHTSSNLIDHRRRCHEPINKRFACEICSKRFYDRSKLKRHLDSHNDVKRFKCEMCYSVFSRRCQWRKHLQKQHSVIIPAQRPGRQPSHIHVTLGGEGIKYY